MDQKITPTDMQHAPAPRTRQSLTEEGFTVALPVAQTAPVVFASPHSGRQYPDDFLAASRLDSLALRQSEDAFVEEIFAGVVEFGAPLIAARFPRAYVDVNREAMELDPEMFIDSLPARANTDSPRVAAGLGAVPRIVASGQDIYERRLPYREAENRIERCYKPYHRALSDLVTATVETFGGCLLVDCHSMPSGVVGPGRPDRRRPDIVIGDCWGDACMSAITDALEDAAHDHGFATQRNVPYAGGFTTRHYGRPDERVHAIQIEIRRDLYMDEASVTRLADMDRVGVRLRAVAADLCASARGLLSDQ